MKEVIDEYVERFGQEDAPPPWSIFTLRNNIEMGNMHVVQKVFDGAFEVSHSSQDRSSKS